MWLVTDVLGTDDGKRGLAFAYHFNKCHHLKSWLGHLGKNFSNSRILVYVAWKGRAMHFVLIIYKTLYLKPAGYSQGSHTETDSKNIKL